MIVYFQEILARSSLETQKLELMSTVSEARLRQAALERENIDLKSSQRNNISGSSSIIANGAVRRASHSPSPSPSPASSMMQHNARDNPPRVNKTLIIINIVQSLTSPLVRWLLFSLIKLFGA